MMNHNFLIKKPSCRKGSGGDKICLAKIIRKYRQKKGFAVHDLAVALKVNDTMICALEKADYANLPSSVYMRSFLKSLAYVLGLKYHILLQIYEEEYRVYFEDKQNRDVSLKDLVIKNIPVFTLRQLNSVFLVMGLFVLGGYIFLKYWDFRDAGKVMLSNNQDYEYVSEANYVLEGETKDNIRLTLNGENVTITESGKFRVELFLMQGTNVYELQTEKSGTLSEIKRKVIYLQS
jgi:cytoskeletal protein RodZ